MMSTIESKDKKVLPPLYTVYLYIYNNRDDNYVYCVSYQKIGPQLALMLAVKLTVILPA